MFLCQISRFLGYLEIVKYIMHDMILFICKSYSVRYPLLPAVFRVVQEGYLNSPNPGVNVTLNEFCRKDVEYTVRVNFGTRLPSQDEDDCMFVDDASVEMTLEPGQTKFFRLDKVKVPTGMVYCSDATLNGNDLGTTGQGTCTFCTIASIQIIRRGQYLYIYMYVVLLSRVLFAYDSTHPAELPWWLS